MDGSQAYLVWGIPFRLRVTHRRPRVGNLQGERVVTASINGAAADVYTAACAASGVCREAPHPSNA